MRAYIITPAHGPREWVTVRAQAQGESKDRSGGWTEEDVPNKLADLIPLLNRIERDAYDRGAAAHAPTGLAAEPTLPPQAEAAAAPQPVPRPALAPVPAPVSVDLTVSAIEEAIMEAKGAPFGRYLCAAIGRLGELGREGWEQFHAFRNFTRDAERSQAREKRPYAAAFDERGLRYLALAQIALLDDARSDGVDIGVAA